MFKIAANLVRINKQKSVSVKFSSINIVINYSTFSTTAIFRNSKCFYFLLSNREL